MNQVNRMANENAHNSRNQIENQIQTFTTINVMREQAIRAAIKKLYLTPGSQGLDAGCGIGNITGWLAEAVLPDGHVTGCDISDQYLMYARKLQKDLIDKNHISFQKGDVNHLPFSDNHFDWVWSMDTLWPGPSELGCPSDKPFSMVRELVRVVKPGGKVALLFWSSQKLLPGYPLLEARLNTTSQATAPFREGMSSEQHMLRALTWLHEEGLEDCNAYTFVADVRSPLNDDMRTALLITFDMFYEHIEKEISPEDWKQYNRLCQPGSRDFILDRPDYYAFITYTMFLGKLPTDKK